MMKPPDGEYSGVSTTEARKILLAVAKRCLENFEDAQGVVPMWTMARQELRQNWASVGAMVALLLGYALCEHRRVSILVLSLLVMVLLLMGIVIKVVWRRCDAFELHDRISEACEALAQASHREKAPSAGASDTPQRNPHGVNVGLQQGNALSYFVSVYRNGLWQRVPKLLLVEGDVVALMGGDTAPCTAEVLRLGGEGHVVAGTGSGTVGSPQFPWVFQRTGTKVVSGQVINLRPTVSEHFVRKTMVSATSPALLLLCGDMRCYLLLETPLEAHLQRSLSPAGTKRRNSLIRERVKHVSTRCHRAMIVVSLLAVIVGGIRMVLIDSSREEWALYLLVIPSQVAVCLLPMALPMYLAAGETMATAHLLAFLEICIMLTRKSESKGDRSNSDSEVNEFDQIDQMDQMDAEEREEATSNISHAISWQKAREYLLIVLAARWQSGTRRRGSHRVSPIVPVPAAPYAHRKSNDAEVWLDMQRDSRTPVRSTSAPADDGSGPCLGPERDHPSNNSDPGFHLSPEMTSHRHQREQYADVTTSDRISSWWNRIPCASTTLQRHQPKTTFTGRDPVEAVNTNDPIGSKQILKQRLTLLAVPMLRSGLVERLGAVTTLCMLDEDAVCQSTSVIKEVFLLDSKDDAGGGSGTVLDLHLQHGKGKGKGKMGVRFEDPHWSTHLPALKPIGLSCLLAEVQKTERQQSRGKFSHTSPIPRDTVTALPQTRPVRTLVYHVRDTQPMEHLTGLWKAIGFCSADRTTFREWRRIHVINPKLAAERAIEDAHALGQEESRRRGTIQPHVTSVMTQDRRSGTLQLHSQGNPSIVLGMCRDYWDGRAISNLPANLRKSILHMHQQWSLEDLDVVAFAYAPVPYTVNPFLTSSSKHPDYLIHKAHAAGRGRARGGVLSPASPMTRKSISTGTSNAARRERNGADASGTQEESKLKDDGDDRVLDKHDERTESRALRATGKSPRSSSIRPPERQVSGMQGLSSDPPLVHQPKGDFQGSESQKPQFFSDPSGVMSVGGIISETRGLPRGGSEGCLTQAGMQGTQADGVLGTVFEDAGSRRRSSLHRTERTEKHEKSVTFGARHESPHKKQTESSKGSQQALGFAATTDRNTSGQPRFSVDDYSVNVRNRAELLMSQRIMAEPGAGDNKMAEVLWNLMHEQVFLGMAASFVPPKRDIVALIEDVEAAGVRFVYFSPRNMRRSKALAESMGIETDWNCAISLRPLEDSTQPDPHRMTSSYADWDVKARLPHGIASIRDHIERVDNVPLLVSLFTDATPSTTRDMLAIYQENDESVLAVGMSHRAVNGDLFRAADLSFSVESLPLNQSLASLPVSSTWCFSAIDAAFNSSIVGLHAALSLGDVAQVRRGGALEGLDEIGTVIIDVIREGRRLLANSYQALSFLFLGSFTCAMVTLLSACLPISMPLVLTGDHVIWVLWLVVPLLACSFLASPADGTLMKRTPEKNDPKVIPISTRMIVHMLLRTVPTALICAGLYVFLVSKLIMVMVMVHDQDLVMVCDEKSAEQEVQWTDIVRCLARDGVDTDKTKVAAGQAADLVIVELVLCLITQSASLMYRTTSIRREHPWKNWVWRYVVIIIVIIQVVYLWASAGARYALHLLYSCPWEAMVVGALCPLAMGVTAELLKHDDARAHDRYITLLRLEFDTRLGMHSPR